MSAEYDVVVVGGGIVGLATALALASTSPSTRLAVVDKEADVAQHQSGNNSGIIHSGLYYTPQSLKAELCVRGAERMVSFCGRNGIPFRRDGKVVVATSDDQMNRLNDLYVRGVANGLTGIRRLDGRELAQVEPGAKGVAALHVPTTGTVDFGLVANVMADLLDAQGCEVVTGFAVDAIDVTDEGVRLHAGSRSISTLGIVNCAGLHADRVAAMAGVDPPVRIVPFRGEYYDVVGRSADLVRASIYPVPDPSLPFLGVHLSRSADGAVHAGPNAVLATAREGYSRSMFDMRDAWESLSYGGLMKVGRQHWRSGLSEAARSMSRRRFARSVRALVPDVAESDLIRGGAGVRAQAVSPDGRLLDDFLIVPSSRAIHVLNAPSPGATSSLAIGDYLAVRIRDALGLD